MLFNSLHFLVFFPIVLLIYYLVPERRRYLWLLISSYYFYMCWNVKYVLLLLFSTVVTYACGRKIEIRIPSSIFNRGDQRTWPTDPTPPPTPPGGRKNGHYYIKNGVLALVLYLIYQFYSFSNTSAL